jgi:hypothetical protein
MGPPQPILPCLQKQKPHPKYSNLDREHGVHMTSGVGKNEHTLHRKGTKQ